MGDIVRINEDTLTIEEINPRINELERPVVANVDMALIVTSVKKPDLSLSLLDKELSVILANNIEPVLCLTKLDLLNKEELKKILNKFLIDRKSDIEDTILFSPNSKFEPLSKELLEEVELVNDIEIDNDIEQIEEKIEEKKQLNYKNKKFLIENNIDVDAAEKLLGEMSTYDDALADFIKEADSKYNLLQGYMKIDKLEKCYNIFRTIKTDTRYLGFIELNSIFSNLEKAIKENDIDYVKNNIKTSLKVFKKYIEISKEYLGK